MTIIYRVEFTAETTPAAAHEAVSGLNGGNVGGIRSAYVGTVTTAWFTITGPDETDTPKAGPIEKAVNAELDADERVTAYSVTA